MLIKRNRWSKNRTENRKGELKNAVINRFKKFAEQDRPPCYPAYKDTRGTYQFPGYVLSIDHVQGDPFASPSKVSVHVKGKTAAFPQELYREAHQRIALQDELTRQFGRRAEQFAFKAKGSGKSGLISVSRCGQEVLERTACRIDPSSGDIILRTGDRFSRQWKDDQCP